MTPRRKRSYAGFVTGLLLALFLAAAPEAGIPAARRVAVVVVAKDASVAGDLQFETESAVAQMAPAAPAAEMAPVLGSSEVPAPDAPDLEKQTKDLVASGQAAYYGNRTTDAVRDLAAAAALLDKRVRVGAAERASVRLALVAARIAAADRAGALEDARRALAYDRELEVDPDAYPPSVVAVFEEAKAAQPTRHQVTITRLPASSSVRVDGAPVNGSRTAAGALRFETGPGRHWLDVTAPGFRAVERAIEVVADTSIAVPLAIDARAGLSQALRTVVLRGEAKEVDEKALSDLGKRLSVDAIAVVVADAGSLRGAVWSAGAVTFSATFPADAAGVRRTAAWVSTAVRSAVGGSGMPGGIHLVSDVMGAKVLIDGKLAGETPFAAPLTLSPGPHTILITAAGFDPVARAVEIRPGETDRLDLALLRSPPPPPPPLLKRPVFWLAAAAAIAAGGGGAAAYSSSQEQRTITTTDDRRTSTVTLELP